MSSLPEKVYAIEPLLEFVIPPQALLIDNPDGVPVRPRTVLARDPTDLLARLVNQPLISAVRAVGRILKEPPPLIITSGD
jgi:hypothetical protein